jgi:hypothetical protein
MEWFGNMCPNKITISSLVAKIDLCVVVYVLVGSTERVHDWHASDALSTRPLWNVNHQEF